MSEVWALPGPVLAGSRKGRGCLSRVPGECLRRGVGRLCARVTAGAEETGLGCARVACGTAGPPGAHTCELLLKPHLSLGKASAPSALLSDEIVALKRLKMEKEKEGFPITSLREINTILKAQHPNIVTVRVGGAVPAGAPGPPSRGPSPHRGPALGFSFRGSCWSDQGCRGHQPGLVS